MCQLHQSYIDKSEENWRCATDLYEKNCTYPDVIASRMYYSMFLLIKGEMVANNENSSMPDYMKMADDASTGVHDLARQYINNYLVQSTNDLRLGRNWSRLVSLRVKADYKRQPVENAEIQNIYETWQGIRERWMANITQKRRISA